MMRFRSGFACLVLATGLPVGPTAAQTPSGGEFRINEVTASVQRPTSVASAADGSFVVVWDANNQDGAAGYGIFARRYDAAGNPGSEFQVNQFFTGAQNAASVGVASDGSFAVAWQSANQPQDGNGSGIFARRYNSVGAAIGAEFRVNTTVLGNQMAASVASASNGSFVVVWQSPDAQNVGVFGQRYNASGGAVGGEFPINVFTLLNQQRPRVASAADGRFVVVWESSSPSQDGSASAVMGRRYDALGNPQASEFQVNSYTTNNQSYPAVAMTSDGRFVVVWASYLQDGRFWGVFGQRYDANGAAQGPEFQVNTFSTANQHLPAVAAADDGSFAVTWRSYQQELSAGIRGQMYDGAGNPASVEFAVNTYTTNLQGTPFMSSAPNGAFVVVWRSALQDGSGDGGFGQRYGFSDLIFADGFEP